MKNTPPQHYNYLIAILFLLFSNSFVGQESIQNDSLTTNFEKYKKHVLTLDYIGRKTNSNQYFLNLAKIYCDSILTTGVDDTWALGFKDKIDLTIATCEYNMNYKVQLFPYFNGFPSYMGFADDAIEYAYDDALNDLFATKFKKIGNTPLANVNITSIITRGDCDDEMFEIVKQTIMAGTDHYVLTKEDLERLLGVEQAVNLTNGKLDRAALDLISTELKLDNLGIFDVSNIDVIDEKIWLVQSKFNTYSTKEGFTEAVFTKGYCHDKKGFIGFNIILLILESIVFITLIAIIDEKITKYIRTRKLFSIKELLYQLSRKIKFVTICFISPILLSTLMIFSVSYLAPDATDHYLESSAMLWIVALTLAMSIIPTFINLFIVNRLQIDGFHNLRGYRTFANASLYATYIPLFIFYIIQFEYYPRAAHFILVILTFVLGDLIARSYFQFTSKTKHTNLKTQALFGIISGIVALIIFNTYALKDISLETFAGILIFIAPISIIHWLIGKYIDILNSKKLQLSHDNTLLDKLVFIKDVVDPITDLYDPIQRDLSDDNLNVMLIAAPMGMGKTRSLNEAKKTFTENDWKWYYGDCDKIQDENSVSFEPFLEAFKNLLKVEEFVDRSLQMESISGDAVKAITDIAGGPSDMINDFKRDESLTMTEICVEIAEKLESSKNKTVFVMEDLHWIDPESYAFLKHFIKTVNRNDFIRKNMCIILTIRNDEVNNLRGVNLQGLKDDLMALNKNLDTKAIITDLLIEDSFKVKDFINHVSNQNVQFKIQDDSLADINYKLNSSLLDKNSTLKITPLYILKIVEQWIQNKVLKYTPDGYVLTDSIESIELPNTKEIDSYYHAILEGFDVKWARMLESAAIIGSKFNADILSQVWGFELLEILGFLEEAEAKGLIVDLSEEDNIYEFSDKRIVSAIKSYFPSSQNSGVKQIIIEYNKRYIDLKKDIINVPSEYSLEEILSVVRRLTLMSSSSSYNEATKRLIFEIIVRMILNEEHEKINAFESFLRNRNLIELSDLIAIINTIANPNTPFNEVIKQGNELLRKEYSSDSVELELKIYGLMFKQTRFGSQYENNEDSFVKTNELFFIGEKINTLYKGEVLLSLGFLYLNCAQFSFEEAKSFLNKLSENLKDHSNFKAFSYYIEHWIISTTLSQNYDVDEVDQSSETLLKDAIATKNLRLIKKCLKLRILIVTKYIKDKEKAVVIFTENIAHLKTNSINNHWVSSVLYFFATWSGEIYCKNNPEQAEIDLKLCEEFIYKRFDANVWTKLIEEFYNAKKKFHKSTDQLDAFKSTCYEHKELISNTIGEKTKQYGDACFHIANYHLLVKEYESSLEYRLLRIKNYEDLYVNKPKPWSLQAAYISTSFFYSKYLKDYKNGLDYALKALEVLNNTQGIPDYSIAATYNRVFKAYIELEEYNAAIELALKHFEEVKNTENVPHIKLGFAYNLIAISYKWSAEKIKDKKIASSYFVAAIKHFNLAITSWSEDTNDQNLKRARATINVGLCENEVLRIGLETKSINAKKIIEMIEKGLKEIKEPKLESFLTKPTKELIEKAEATLIKLSK
jgi:hypothetical protein